MSRKILDILSEAVFVAKTHATETNCCDPTSSNDTITKPPEATSTEKVSIPKNKPTETPEATSDAGKLVAKTEKPFGNTQTTTSSAEGDGSTTGRTEASNHTQTTTRTAGSEPSPGQSFVKTTSTSTFIVTSTSTRGYSTAKLQLSPTTVTSEGTLRTKETTAPHTSTTATTDETGPNPASVGMQTRKTVRTTPTTATAEIRWNSETPAQGIEKPSKPITSTDEQATPTSGSVENHTQSNTYSSETNETSSSAQQGKGTRPPTPSVHKATTSSIPAWPRWGQTSKRTVSTHGIGKQNPTEGYRQNIETPAATSNTITEDQNVTTKESISIKTGLLSLCDPNNITVFIDKKIFGRYKKYGPMSLDYNDGENCEGIEYENHYRYTIAPNILGCGTRFAVNDTHVNFTNTISNRVQYERVQNILGGGRNDVDPVPLVHMNVLCTFPLEVAVHTDLIPDLRSEILTFNVSGVGQFSAVMQLFKDEEYRYPYFASPSISMDQRLRVGITLLQNKDEDISIAAKKCWATPVREKNFWRKYSLIDEYCPVEGSLKRGLKILGNGQGKRARWEGPVFKFTLFKEVWLHCELKVCFADTCRINCSAHSTQRSKRSLTYHSGGIVLSTGPVYRKRENTKGSDFENSQKKDFEKSGLNDQKVIVVVSVLCGIILLLCITFLILIAKHSKQRRIKNGESRTPLDGLHSRDSFSATTTSFDDLDTDAKFLANRLLEIGRRV